MNERLNELFARRLARTLTPAERLELCGLLLQPELKQQVSELVWQAGDDWQEGSMEMSAQAKQRLMELIMDDKEDNRIRESVEASVIEIYNAPAHRAGFKKWMVAASIILLLGLGTYLLFFNKRDAKPDAPVAHVTDIEAPKQLKATITLANGRIVAVDSLTSVQDGDIRVTKNTNGEIVYNGSGNNENYNTLDNPRGSAVATITLSDGTKVWLNTASSLRYFASNTGKERRVEVSGEAYFEVAKDKDRPFIVKKGEASVTVLGTHFNINAYDDNDDIRITLLEGSVQVRRESSVSSRESVIIKPSEQARMSNRESRINVSRDIDIEEVMAWKNGIF
ncbi:MAG TPA: FecR domain-containing protein, partial [Chitinophagaceae bacterium]|nr:FecR domain-containing protein [Chitinophagaceae bacterium]